MNPPSSLKAALELCQRLGIKYVSTNPSSGASPVPMVESPVIQPASMPPSVSSAVPDTPVVLEVSETEVKTVPPELSEIPASYLPNKTPWLTASAETLQAMELMAFDQDICQCQKCPLGATRKKFVFGSGNPQAPILFVGEAPGADEDEQGLPFVGKAGQLLTKIIESTQTWKRADVFICNVLKCRPPGNRTPQPEEVEQCRPYLEEQIRIIKPKLIMALGASAAQALLKTKDSVGKMRNKWHDYEGTPLRVTYHPAALLRFDGYKKDVWQDMKELTAKFAEISQNSAS